MGCVSNKNSAAPRLLWACFLLVLANLVFATSAFAQAKDTRSYRLLYSPASTVPKNCPNENDLRIALAAKLSGDDPFTNDASRTITVTITPKPANIEAHVAERDENGTVTSAQTLHVPSFRCDLLADNIAFVLRDIVAPLELRRNVAKKIDSEAVAPEEALHPEPTPIVETADSRNTHASPPRSPLIPKLAPSLAAGGSWWNAPETALTTTMGIEAQWKYVSLGIEGHYDNARTVPNMPEVHAERAGATLVACYVHPLSPRISMRGCALGQISQLSIDAYKLNVPIPYAPVPVVDIGARVGTIAWILPFLGVEIRVDGAFIARRPQFVLEGNRVWRMAPFTGALRIALVGLFDVFGVHETF